LRPSLPPNDPKARTRKPQPRPPPNSCPPKAFLASWATWPPSPGPRTRRRLQRGRVWPDRGPHSHPAAGLRTSWRANPTHPEV